MTILFCQSGKASTTSRPQGARPRDTKTRVITVMMPNDNDKVGEEWAKCRTSVADVEKQTGLVFFDRIAPAIAKALKASADSEWTPKPVAKHFGD